MISVPRITFSAPPSFSQSLLRSPICVVTPSLFSAPPLLGQCLIISESLFSPQISFSITYFRNYLFFYPSFPAKFILLRTETMFLSFCTFQHPVSYVVNESFHKSMSERNRTKMKEAVL